MISYLMDEKKDVAADAYMLCSVAVGCRHHTAGRWHVGVHAMLAERLFLKEVSMKRLSSGY